MWLVTRPAPYQTKQQDIDNVKLTNLEWKPANAKTCRFQRVRRLIRTPIPNYNLRKLFSTRTIRFFAILESISNVISLSHLIKQQLPTLLSTQVHLFYSYLPTASLLCRNANNASRTLAYFNKSIE